MNKILIGVIVGAIAGVVDGATAWFEPSVRPEILSIIMYSTIKGVIAGIAAGWYARRVSSVPKGIAFGFGVGLLLAFLVALMPDPKTGEHYWWQIMLPGAILGGVIGWATQRYGRPVRVRGAAVATIACMLFTLNAFAHHGAHPLTANAAFDKLKSLAGNWQSTMLKPDGDKATVVYRVTGGGSVVMETMFAGTDHEMINMYTVDGDSIVATHYCSAGNQPVLKLNAAKSTESELVFDYVSKTGKSDVPYINGVSIRFGEDGKVVESWSSSKEGPHMDLYLNSRGEP